MLCNVQLLDWGKSDSPNDSVRLAASGWSAHASNLVFGNVGDWTSPRSGLSEAFRIDPGHRVVHEVAFHDCMESGGKAAPSESLDHDGVLGKRSKGCEEIA